MSRYPNRYPHSGDSGGDSDGGGGFQWSPVTVSSAYTASDGDEIRADASGGGFTVTLPAAGEQARVRVKKVDTSSNAVDVVADGTTLRTITAEQAFEFSSDGSGYEVF